MRTPPASAFATHLDRAIYRAVRGHDEGEPQTLMGIIAVVDAGERLVLTHAELAGGLERLIGAGLVAEPGPHAFAEATGGDRPRPFSGLTEPQHAAAVTAYRAWFERKLDESDDDESPFVQQKLVVRWALPGDRWPTDDDEDAAEQLAESLAPILEDSGLGEIIGFESGSGQIDILVFGKATDDDVDEIRDAVAPVFHQHGCPPGSRLIRCYRERGEDVVSDVVPGA